MATTDHLDRYLGSVDDAFSPELAETIIRIEPSEEVKSRVAELAEKANAGTLSDEQRAEYERYVDIDDLIGLLKAKAHRFLESKLRETTTAVRSRPGLPAAGTR